MKTKTIFVCSSCGYESPKWMGKCPACNEWNTFYEEKDVSKTGTKDKKKEASQVIQLNKVEKKENSRIKTGIDELDRVLGGGFVIGSLTLLGGEPGIGKSTLILQICDNLKIDGKILYVSGEESAEQIKIRADRLGVNKDNIMFLSETDIDNVENQIEKMEPEFIIIDSIQTMYSDEITSSSGSVSQVREITNRIMKMCKQKSITTIIIGHVTKDGNIAGPRVLEHMVDTVLYLEGERYFSYRILRGVKNRFGSTNEIGMFEMADEGLVEIKDPSSILISDKENSDASGTVVAVSIEGTRPLLVELQALVTQSFFGMPRRNAIGIDYNRLTLLAAVLDKRARINLGNQDIYLNVVGGIKINEPALDLGICLSIVSSFKNIPIDKKTVAIGEVGLTGEIRNVNMIDKRIKEAEKLGYRRVLIPESNKKLLKNDFRLDIIGVKNISDAIDFLKL